jgi:amino acid adenylation domain-containing protein
MRLDVMSNVIELSDAKKQLLARLRQGEVSLKTQSVPTIPQRQGNGSAPLTPGQRQLWLLDQMAPDLIAYNLVTVFNIPGQVDPELLKQSLERIIARHEILRTVFRMEDGAPVQVVLPTIALPYAYHDLSSFSEDTCEDEAARLAREAVSQPFDLSCGPLLRALHFKLANNRHWFCIIFHHIIIDGYSLVQVLAPELHATYTSIVAEKGSETSPLPIQYADYAVWLQQEYGDEKLAGHLDYWRSQLDGLAPQITLPVDRNRQSSGSYCGDCITVHYTQELQQSLKALAQREGVTFHQVLLTALNIVLARYSGQGDIAVGITVAQRDLPETRPLLGYFLNTLVLRTDFSGNPTAREALRLVKRTALEAYTHQETSFESVVRALQPERGVGQNPFFDVMLSFQPPLAPLPDGWYIEPMRINPPGAKFALNIEIEERAEGLCGRIEYNTDMFDAATIERMRGHWENVLRQMDASLDTPIDQIALLSNSEKQQILVEWNATNAAFPSIANVAQMVEAQVARTPNAEAVVMGATTFTYAELNRRANRLARELRELGVGPDVMVGICMERSPAMLIALLGILKAGGAYVPLDPAYPAARIADIMEQAQSPVLITETSLLSDLPESGATKYLCLDTLAMPEAIDSANLDALACPEYMAYAIFTSGSTGQPKGVLVNHCNFINLLQGMVSQGHLHAGETTLAVTRLTFDVASSEMFLPLVSGARIVIADTESTYDGRKLARLIEQYRVTFMQATPATWRLLIESGWRGSKELRVLSCGEALQPVLARQLLDRSANVLNYYGPTETTIYSSGAEIVDADAPITIGKPLPNYTQYVLDASLQPLPIGVPGEIYIGGAGVTRGYLGRDDLTTERYIADLFSAKPGARLYRSGDLGRYRPDGSIEVLGRADFQVKIRGYRIELGEIEAILAKHPAIRACVVVAHENMPGNKQLVAYQALHSGITLASADIQQYLAAKLPSYMVPTTFLILDELPLSRNGKVDRKRLPMPDYATKSSDTFVPPATPVQQQLAKIWGELLGVQPIGIRDNFFYLGGHSLMAALMLNKVQDTFGVEVPLRVLFTGPTIEQLAMFITDHSVTAYPIDWQPIFGIQTTGDKVPLFFVHGDWTNGPFYCYKLARELGPDQPFYVLEPYPFDQREVPTLDALASYYVDAIRAVQPEGPYQIGGYCNGAIIAYTIACQLQAQKQEVSYLLLFDPMSPYRYSWIAHILDRAGRRYRISRERQLALYMRLRHAYKFLQPSRAHRKDDMAALQRIDPDLVKINAPDRLLLKDQLGIIQWLLSLTTSASFKGSITLLFNETESHGSRQVIDIPAGIGTEMHVHYVPGAHLTCLTDFSSAAAKAIRTTMENASLSRQDRSMKTHQTTSE